MSEKIKNIIADSIAVKGRVLNDERIISTVEKIVDQMVSALKNRNRIISVAMVEAPQMHNTWPLSFLVGFILIATHCPLKLYIVILLISLPLQMITAMM